MGTADYHKPGANNSICDRTGFKIKSTNIRKEWTGQSVRTQSWEPRHPQDLIRSIPDRQDVEDPNPESEDTFLAVGEVTVSDL